MVRALAVSRRRQSARACSSRESSADLEVNGGWQDFVIGGHHGADTHLFLDLLLDLGGHVGVLEQEVAGVLLALAQLLALVGEPRTGLADEALLDTHVDERALL